MELLSNNGLSESLFELSTLNKEEWGGICSENALMLKEAGTPRLSILQLGIN